MLAGHWEGEYNSPALGRHGKIQFSLDAENGVAKGIVAMTPQGSVKPYEPSSLEHDSSFASPSTPQLLSIRFVRADRDTISGALDQYWDPDRNCDANTHFIGRFGDGAIEGTFTTTWTCGPGEASGRWQVQRTKK